MSHCVPFWIDLSHHIFWWLSSFQERPGMSNAFYSASSCGTGYPRGFFFFNLIRLIEWYGFRPTWSFFSEISMELLRQRRISLVDSLFWNPILPLKLSFFTWRLVHNFLPLDVTLRSRGLSIPSICDCCRATEETTLHLFLEGPVAKEVWRRF